MKIHNQLKLQIVLLLLAIGISTPAADLNNAVFERALYGTDYQVPEKTINLFGNKTDKKAKKEKKKKIEVEHFDTNASTEEQTLTDAEYIKSLKRADKKRIRNDKFELNVTRSGGGVANEDADSVSNAEDMVVSDPSDKKFFSKNKKKKQKDNSQNQQQSVNSSIMLTADETNYNPESNEIEAIGNAKFEVKGQDFELYGDKIIFSYETSSVKAYQNVKIIKGDNVTTGDFIYIDMSTACGWIQSPVTSNYSVSVKAKEAYVYSDKIQENDGVIRILEDRRIEAVGQSYSSILNDISMDVGDSYMAKPEPTSMKFKVKEIIVTPKKEHNDIVLKGVSVYYKKIKLAVVPEIRINSDKNGSVMQTNVPEIGGDTILGMYVGPSFVADLPFSSTLRVAPLLMYDTDKSRLGVGGFVNFLNEYNDTQVAYGTAKKNFTLKGRQKLTKNLSLLYTQNTYGNEWFMGARRPAYGVALNYRDKYYIRDLDAHFEHNLSIGAYADWNRSSFRDSGEGRARWMGQFNKDFFRFTNSANNFAAAGGIGLQGMVSQYTSGDTFGLGRIYPYISTTFKGWSQSLSYFQTGVGGGTPFMFDDYYYGKSSLQIIEGLRLNKYLSIGYVATMSLAGRESYYRGPGRNTDIDRFLQENQFLISVGPDEAKVTLGYDFTRQSTHLYYSMLLGSKDMDIKFDKTVINDPMSISDERKEKAFVTKMRNLKYKVFPATNPNFDRARDLYPQLIPANGDEDIELDSDDEMLRQELWNNPMNPLNQIKQNQDLMRDDRM